MPAGICTFIWFGTYFFKHNSFTFFGMMSPNESRHPDGIIF